MKLHLHTRPDSLLIHSCVLGPAEEGGADGAGGAGNAGKDPHRRYRIRIADTWYTQSLILTPQGVQLWAVEAVSALRMTHFQALAELGAEVVILGVGARAVFPDSALTRPLMPKRLGLDVMDTAAACRTYNILAGDGRAAVAALIV